MPESVPRQIGPYEIDREIGRGGMGVVYRAHDARLGRVVAIKALPEEVAADPDRRARFEREARLLASLNHPNIAGVHGLEEADGRTYIILEHVEGDDLAARLEAGPLAIDEAVELAAQIASALESAHAAGVVHRDLKPANVKITPEGTAKVLDFGLAKAIGEAPSSISTGDSPTMPQQASPTMPGVILGTAGYMSPEQARGRAVDERSDIFSFGCVVFEMLTGAAPFPGETVTDSIGAALHVDPEWSRLPPTTPPSLRRLLHRCLVKDRRRRLHSVADARVELEDPISEPAAETTVAGASASRSARSWIAGLLLLLVASVAGNALLLMGGDATERASTSARTRHLSLQLPAGMPLAGWDAHPLGLGRPTVAITPDGSTVVCVVLRDGVRVLHRRRLDEPAGALLEGSEGAYYPRISPDGTWIAFFVDSELRKMPLDGGGVVVLGEATNALGLCWSSPGELIVAENEGTKLLRFDAETGQRRPVPITSATGTNEWRWPSTLPGGGLLAARSGSSSNPEYSPIQLFSSDLGGDPKVMFPGGSAARYLPSGHLVVARGSGLSAMRFDPARPETIGPAVPMITGVTLDGAGAAHYDVSDDGTLVYAPGGSTGVTNLVWVDREGVVEPLEFPPAFLGEFQLSPDRRRLAVVVGGVRDEVWIYDLQRGTRRRIAIEQVAKFVTWSPDGTRIAMQMGDDVAADDHGSWFLGWLAVDAAEQVHKLVTDRAWATPSDWAEQGIVFHVESEGSWDIALVDPDEPDELVMLANTPDNEWGGAISPDDRWLAYTSDATGQYEVYLQPFPDGGRRVSVSVDGGEEPIWSLDGSRLFYRNGTRWLSVAVDATAGTSELRVGRPTTVVEGSYLNVPGRSYDIADDEARLLMLRSVERGELDHVNVVLDWTSELTRRVGAGE